MNLKQFDKIVTDQLSRSELVLMGKGTEYAEEATDETEVDRLAHFKKAAALQDMTTAQAAFGMLSKHLVSVADMVGSRQSYPLTQWNEKITDSITVLRAARRIAVTPVFAIADRTSCHLMKPLLRTVRNMALAWQFTPSKTRLSARQGKSSKVLRSTWSAMTPGQRNGLRQSPAICATE